MDTKDFHLTSDGLKELKEELGVLLQDKRPRLIERVTIARGHGDLSENSEYSAAREELAFIEGRIEELEEIIAKAILIKPIATNGEIKLGSRVTLKSKNQLHTYELVGEWEADPLEKKISHTSPLGQALIGKKKGEKVNIEAPAGQVVYQIQKIH